MNAKSPNTQKHTPGPWRIVCHPGGVAIASDRVSPDPETCARYLFVAEVKCTASPNPLWRQIEELEPNARLIASAPELLEALLLALPFVEDAQEAEYKPGHLSKAQKIIRAAIVKATEA